MNAISDLSGDTLSDLKALALLFIDTRSDVLENPAFSALRACNDEMPNKAGAVAVSTAYDFRSAFNHLPSSWNLMRALLSSKYMFEIASLPASNFLPAIAERDAASLA
jgi:hypothetical protein